MSHFIPDIKPGGGGNDVDWLRWLAQQGLAPSAQQRLIEIAERLRELNEKLEKL